MGISRRGLFGAGVASVVTSVVGKSQPRRPQRVLRIAHLTDIHVQPERDAARGFERALESAQTHRPDLIINGGDAVMNALNADRARVKTMWDVFENVLRANTNLPVRHVIGNHDVWGWSDRKRYKAESGFGKQFALDRLEMESSYYAFSRAGWRIIVVDSIHPRIGNGYVARIDNEQYDWLKSELTASAGQPVLIVSHAPVLSASAFFHGMNERTGNWEVPSALMHVDARRLTRRFAMHPNVKACISGHVHLVDRVTYRNVNYFTNGAVSAGWWSGPFQECQNGYAIIDLFDNGTLLNRYHTFRWPR